MQILLLRIAKWVRAKRTLGVPNHHVRISR